jgi:hypothetical protein
MKFLGKINLMGNTVKNMTIDSDDQGIEFPGEGRLVRKNGRLLLGVAYIDGSTQGIAYVPMLQEKNTHLHDQTVPSVEWIITHNMNSTRLAVQVWPEGEVGTAEKIEAIDADTVRVTFSIPVTGTATVIVGNIDGLPKPDIRFEQAVVDQTSVMINHGLGYEPIIRVLNEGGLELLNYSVTHPTVNSSMLTFTDQTSATVYCF